MSVKECLNQDVYSTADIKVQVITRDDTKHPIMHNEQIKYETDCVVAEATGTIELVLWEDAIDQVDMGSSYHFQFLKVCIFDDAKYVNLNEPTIISLINNNNAFIYIAHL